MRTLQGGAFSIAWPCPSMALFRNCARSILLTLKSVNGVKNASRGLAAGGLLCPGERTSSGCRGMSEKCQQRKWPTLFDHLVGSGEHGRRHGKAEGLSGLEIDDQFELGGLHNAAEGASGARRHSGTGNFRCR